MDRRGPASDLASLSDEDLVERHRAGDADAFRVLSDRYFEKLRGRIERGLSPGVLRRMAASDILQEANLVALRRFADFEDRGEGSFGAWFGKIVDLKIREAIQRHVAADKRCVRREVSRADRCSTANFAGRGHTPSQVLIGRETEQAAMDAMARLPERDREVLQLLQVRKLTTTEAATRLGITRDALRQRYARALARFEEMLGLSSGDDDGRRGPTR
jgi:RNA polymerase sigma-70 factor (ECF subfamily)